MLDSTRRLPPHAASPTSVGAFADLYAREKIFQPVIRFRLTRYDGASYDEHGMRTLNSNPVETARRAAGLSQQQLADAVGLTQSAISLIESDRRRLKLAMAAKIAGALGVSLDSLVRPSARGRRRT